MLKPQDTVILLKLLASPEHLAASQNQLAVHLCISVSEVHAGLQRLKKSGLLQHIIKQQGAKPLLQLIQPAIEEFLLSGVKYVFPAELSEYTRGIPTSYAAPVLEKYFTKGSDPVPVWPYAEGTIKGLAVSPLYSSVPKSLSKYPDEQFYALLALIDAIRLGRARERNIAEKLLKEQLQHV